MANTLKIKRGTAATIPQGQLAEPLFTTDTYDLYIGKGAGGNQRIQNYIASGTSSQFLKGDGSLDSTTYQATSEKGQNNGYASLDAGGKIPAAQLPSSVIEYKGTWNASTNTPTLADGTGDAGDVYIVSVGGTQNLGSGSITFDAGDWVMYNGSIWQKSTGSNAVASVNGQTGIVSIGVNDLDDATITSPSNGQLLQYSTGTNKWVNWTPTYISAAITSLNGLTGATQTFATGTTGTDFNISSASGVHTFNIPSASATNRGLVTTGTQTFAGSKIFNENLKINTDTDPTSLSGKQLVIRASSVNDGQSAIVIQGYDKTSRWVINGQDNVDSYNYVLYSNTVTIGSTPSYNPKFLLSQAGVLRLHNYTTNGLAAFTGSDGTISSVARTINGTTFDGSSNITITANTANAITFNNGGAGAASGTTFDGSTARTISYNTIGAQAALTNPVTGTGTQHYLTKFTATGSTVGDSTITNNGRLTAFESNQNNGTEFKIKNTTTGTAAQPYITLEGESTSRFLNFGKVSSTFTPLSWLNSGDGYIYNGTANLVIYNVNDDIQLKTTSGLIGFTSGGNLGIATLSPSTYTDYLNVTLKSTGANGVNLDFKTSSDTRQAAIILSTNSTFDIVAVADIPLKFRTNDVERGRFTNTTGNFIAGPDGAATTARLTSYLGSTALVANTSNDGLRLQVKSYGDGSRNTISWGQDDSNLTLGRFGLAWNNTTSQMCFVWRDMYNTTVGSTEIMRLTSGGRLGIGVDPSYNLDVVGNGRFNGGIADYGLSVTNVEDSSQGLLVRSSDNDTTLYLARFQSSIGATSQTWVDRFSIAKNGSTVIGDNIPAVNVRLWVKGEDQTASNYAMDVTDSLGQSIAWFRNDKAIRFYGALTATSATFSSNVQVNSYQIINGVANGTSTYLQFNNNGTAIGYVGSSAAINSGASTSVTLGVSSGAGLTISSTGAATFSSSVTAQGMNINGASDAVLNIVAPSATAYVSFRNVGGKTWGIGNSFVGTNTNFQIYNLTDNVNALSFVASGAATFGSSVTATGNIVANSPSAGNTGEGIIAGTSFKIDATGTSQSAKMYVVTKTLSDTYGSAFQIQFANSDDNKGFGYNINTSGGYETYVKDSSANWQKAVTITQDRYFRLATKGIQFNGDTAEANSLDDYEEGTWTPVVKVGTTTNSGTATGVYTKIGRVVYIQATITSITKSGTGSLSVEGLPFTVGASPTFGDTQAHIRWDDITTDGIIYGYFSHNSTKISIQDYSNTGYTGDIQAADLGATYQLYGISGFYMV